MNIFISLSSLALRQVVDGACAALGVKESGEAVVGFLTERFTDHSQRLTRALQTASDNAWKALEIALAGDSLWERCKAAVARAEDRAFAQQVRAFLDATPLPELAGKTTFRQKCLEELRAARKGQALAAGTPDARQLAQGTADFARFGDPTSLVEAEWRLAVGLADQMKQAGYGSLAWLLAQRPQQGMSVLVVAVRYFFRRGVEDDQKLFQGLAFAKLEALGEAQERGFASLSAALAQQGERLEELLADVKAVVVQTHSAVLDLQGQMKGHGEQIGQIGQAVMKLLEQHQLQRREVRPGDSLSIRNEGERQLVKQLVARYRSLPQGERQNVPALLNAIGKLEVVAGDFEAAQRDFQQVATLVADTGGKAEAHFNAYQTALERRDFDAALKEFIEAVKLDAKRYAPFPVGKYHPLRILGAGGFGTAFLCRHKYMNADVVVKVLHLDALDRGTDKVFTEAQVLRQLDHPAIIRISECGYVDATGKVRPHIIMDYFQGQTLESYVKEHGPLPVEDQLAVARQVAEGLQAAHRAKILHRDVKPANLLVRKEAAGWKVKIIDFGLAMPQKVLETSQKASTLRQKETIIGSSIAGTLDYGAPEQMGRRKEAVGPYSDVYGWGKTCCYALFQTTQPLLKHWSSLPRSLAELLEKCLEEDPKQRPAGFAEVLKGLDTGVASSAPAPVVPAPADENPKRERKARLLWIISVAAAVGLVAMIAGGLSLTNGDKERPKVAEAKPTTPKVEEGTEPTTDPKAEPKPVGKWDHLDVSKGTIVEDYVRLKPGCTISTKQTFSGDIEITALARTAKNDIRLYAFNGACVIFNWALNPAQLRVTRPDGQLGKPESGSLATAQVQPLAPNTWYTLRWRVTSAGMKVIVNDKVVFSEPKQLNLSARGPVMVHTYDSPVDVKEFVVKEVRQTATPTVKPPSPPPQMQELDSAGSGRTFPKIAGTSWVNSNNVTLTWQPDGSFRHSRRLAAKCIPIDDRRVAILFSDTDINVLVFNEDYTTFQQYWHYPPSVLATGRKTSSVLGTELPSKTNGPMLGRLAGTKWKNSHGPVLEFRKDGTFTHNGNDKGFRYIPLSENRVLLTYELSHVYVLVFNNDYTAFEQFAGFSGTNQPSFTGTLMK
jgi:serine/threonine protein kinase